MSAVTEAPRAVAPRTDASWWVAALLALSFAAFWPQYWSRLPLGIDFYVHFHAATMLAWMALLITQPWLIRTGRRQLHRALGRSSFVLAPLAVAGALLLAHKRFHLMDDGSFEREAAFSFLPIGAAFVFAAAWTLAMLFRRNAQLHARFMLGTVLPLIDPVVARLVGFYLHPDGPPFLFQLVGFAVTDLLLLGLIWLDRKRPAALPGFLGMLALLLPMHVFWFTGTQTAAWQAVARWFYELPLS